MTDNTIVIVITRSTDCGNWRTAVRALQPKIRIGLVEPLIFLLAKKLRYPNLFIGSSSNRALGRTQYVYNSIPVYLYEMHLMYVFD